MKLRGLAVFNARQRYPVPMNPTARAIAILADRKVREAIDEGKFNHLEGTGQPLVGMDQPLGHEHWIKRWAQHQRLTALMTRRRDERQ